MWVPGLSVGGVLAAWAAAFRSEVRGGRSRPLRRAEGLPNAGGSPDRRFRRLIPRLYFWWDPRKKADLGEGPYVYPGFPFPGMAPPHLAEALYDRRVKPTNNLRRVVLTINPGDFAIRRDVARRFAERSSRSLPRPLRRSRSRPSSAGGTTSSIRRDRTSVPPIRSPRCSSRRSASRDPTAGGAIVSPAAAGPGDPSGRRPRSRVSGPTSAPCACTSATTRARARSRAAARHQLRRERLATRDRPIGPGLSLHRGRSARLRRVAETAGHRLLRR